MRVLTLAAALACGVCTQALGQESQETERENSGTVDSIIVTAQRRSERLQDVPIAVTAVTAEQLEAAGVTDTRQLTQTIPAMLFSRALSSVQPTIRGVGTRNANQGDESNVAVYIDGVYQPVMSSLAFDFLNIERVEVLRGPQGTLFGRNSTGGLVNVITPDPLHDAEGRIVLRAGSFGERSVQGYFTAGLSDALAGDLAVQLYADDGYLKDLQNGGHVGARETVAVRSKWQIGRAHV